MPLSAQWTAVGRCGPRGHSAVQTVDATDDEDVTTQRHPALVITAAVMMLTLSSVPNNTARCPAHTVRLLAAVL